MQTSLFLKLAWERRDLVLLTVLLFLVGIVRGQHAKIGELGAALAAKPKIEFRDKIVEKRVVVRGPVRVVKEIVKAPDGTVTTHLETDRSAETVSTDKARDIEKTETPVCGPPSPSPTRYGGVILGSGGYAGSWVRGVRGGINVFDHWDLGGNLARERSGAVVAGGEIAFRW